MKKQESVDKLNKLYNQISLEDFFENKEFAAYAEKITGEETITETWTKKMTLSFKKEYKSWKKFFQ